MSRRDEVLEAALELLDEVGLDALTTRRLAERLGVRPGALYRHFASKRALLDAMVERITTLGGERPPNEDDWADRVRTVAGGIREAMLTYRDGARLMTTFAAPGPAAIAGWEWFIGVLRSAGASEQLAPLAVDTIMSYVNGFTIEEQARKSAPEAGIPRAERDAQFRAGLNLVLAGVRSSIEEGP
ncbi:TetR/AcrR family transcriptional regulator C-terminal domain-containing protein [Sciscionella marina]|uniref:TetR/AcrR family transcriptional regulator C-terminal domain-containing protein n=1 Tax=Sciscionella marina TaxID=508770 RepID=UPI0003794935|nr:TetR/AcrR family transcriptional regulator C-terminal domain-containing protein [Sciscionella marina]